MDPSFTYLADYRPYPFKIPDIDLNFDIDDDAVIVSSIMHIVPICEKNNVLVLKGKGLDLLCLEINSTELLPQMYELTTDELIIPNILFEPFRLAVKCRIDPFLNTSLEGLYLSGDILATQCEAEGFRRITFHPDRPDVLSRYRVTIEADKEKYPVLLSNGNQISSLKIKNNQSRHVVIWDDPYPKPSYLFALVAGNLEKVEDQFITSSGKSVSLRIYVDSSDVNSTLHALCSLKKAMLWDQNVYGLEYDLDQYNIVAVRHFNMGAMENKSLNLFNSKLVLADANTSTDYELERVESVIAHEYFHNWTGNRITCRDWFQLSLKEGLTVFRDQSFTSDLHDESVKRIQDISLLRNTQFREDSGPTSHPVKPDKYKTIDNFYTTTIYEKGAELIRMLYTLLGHEKFMKGMRIYVNRFDGKAATTEDFVQSIYEGASNNGSSIGFDIDLFCNWYSQKGTPLVTIRREWDPINGILKLKLNQEIPNQPREPYEKLLVIPIRIAFIGLEGRIGQEHLIVLDRLNSEFEFKNLPISVDPPALSVFRGFSAPVNWESDLTDKETFNLLNFDDDPFSRWEAGQRLMRDVILERASSSINNQLEEDLISAFTHLIESLGKDSPAVLATLLSLPCQAELEAAQVISNPLAVAKAISSFKVMLGKRLSRPLHYLLDLHSNQCNDIWPRGNGERLIIGLSWNWLAASYDESVFKEMLDAVSGSSMTLSRNALAAFKDIDCPERDKAMNTFYNLWNDRPVILDSWFALEASIPRDNCLKRVNELINHSKFDIMSPNVVRAVLGGFASNPFAFHNVDGSGYRFIADQLINLDKRNPITASRLLKIFSKWRTYEEPHRSCMKKEIDIIYEEELSSNSREIIDLIAS